MIRPEDVTIIIPHLGATTEQRLALRECRQSLQETIDSKIIIAINGAGDGDQFDFEDKPHQIEMIAMEAQGQCKAVNAAVATTNTPWIFITNDDMIYAPGWFKNLCTLGQGPFVDVDLTTNVLCISPRLVEPQQGAPTFETFFAGGAGGDFDKEKWLGYAEEHTEQKYDLQSGFNLPLLIRRDLWDLVGGYDINYDPWGSNSDSDLEYKIRLAGIQPYQNPNSVVYHFSQTSGTFEPRNRPSWEKNWNYFIEKWGFPRTDDGIWQATFDIPTIEAGRKFTPHWEGFFAK